MKTSNSENLFKRALTLLPGGVDSPVRAFKSVGGTPLFMKEGKGSHIKDEDGNEYIDHCMSWGPLIFGHADTDVIEAVRNTALSGTSFGTPHRYEVELAELVISMVPSIEKVRFVSSGTEATMSAIRLARGFTEKDKIIKLDGCYHGHADFLLVSAGSGLATFGTPDSAGVTQGNAKDTLVVPYNDLEALGAVLEREKGYVAALILEPVPCNYGLILPLDEYLRGVRELCDKYGVVLIFDEVITGFRLAKGGAQEYFGVTPDLTTLGKILGGGLPVGAYGGRKDIMAKIAPDGPVYQAGTLSGNPLAMAAGIATMKKLNSKNFYSELSAKGKMFNDKISPVIKKFSSSVQFRCIESIFCLYFTGNNNLTTVNEIRKCNMKLFGAFHSAMLSRGIYLSPSGYEVGFLSSAHSSKDIDRTVAAIAESLEEIL
ncbi:MAG TPA: glutamate-1-semialdehyde 2,1-aminomutase [Spirochaetota bacterium]|nr:glutamate-1-semialdehyde 2,1-aminomutase [Spirochaetota bacterium]HPS87514.1 glutamate-1-semialdehyde 2,1-aminomutase [Spirochaetota bacterium]